MLVLVMLFLALALGVIGGLLTFHTYLAGSNQTTYEVMRGKKIHHSSDIQALSASMSCI